MAKCVTADLVVDARSELGESPVWDDRRSELLWVDMPKGNLHRWHPTTQRHDVMHVSEFVSMIALDSRGAYVAALRNQIVRLDWAATFTELVATVDVGGECRLNDGKCDSAGRLWLGSTAYDEKTAVARLYCLNTNGDPVSVLAGVTISNGLDWSLDGRHMYYIDSPLKRIDVFDFDLEKGSATNRRALIDTQGVTGEPDGMTVDAEGAIWVAFWGGSRVKRYSPTAEELEEIYVPPANVTSCTFGGPGLTDLFITTAADDEDSVDPTCDSHAGAVFVASLGIQGRPSRRFNS
jgi:sugar lactone lactonase YvrE